MDGYTTLPGPPANAHRAATTGEASEVPPMVCQPGLVSGHALPLSSVPEHQAVVSKVSKPVNGSAIAAMSTPLRNVPQPSVLYPETAFCHAVGVDWKLHPLPAAPSPAPRLKP